MKHEVIYQIYDISRGIKELNSKIEYDRNEIEKLKKYIEKYENKIKDSKEELSKICAENNINIDSLL